MTMVSRQINAERQAWRSEVAATVLLALPMVLTNLAQVAMTATDILMMGRLGSDTIAAGALGTNLYFGPMVLGLGFVLACAPMLASEIGARRTAVRTVRGTVRQGLWLALAISIPLWILLWNGEAILLLLGQDPVLSARAGSYVRAMQWGLLPYYGYMVLRSFICALERPGWALAVVLAAVVFNALANYCLMYGKFGFPAYGLTGAGVATSLANLLMFVGLACVAAFEPQFRRYRLFAGLWRPDPARFAALLRLGLPIAGILAFEVSIFNAAAFMMGHAGSAALAAHAIAMQIVSTSFMAPLGIAQAVTVRVGRAFGAGDSGAIARAGWTGFALGVGFMALMAMLLLGAPRFLVGLFVDVRAAENAEVVQLAVTFLAFAALFQIVDGAQAVGSGMLRGLHDTGVPMLIAAFGYWGVGIPLGAYLSFVRGFGGNGIWIGLSTGLTVVALLLLLRWMARDQLGLEKGPGAPGRPAVSGSPANAATLAHGWDAPEVPGSARRYAGEDPIAP